MYFGGKNMVFWQRDGRRGGLFMGKEIEKVAVDFMGIPIAVMAAKPAGNSLMPLWPPILSPSDFKKGRRHA
jgi:hypothetical protein